MLCALHKQSYMQILLMHCNCSCIVKRYVCSSAFWQVVLPAPFFFYTSRAFFNTFPFPCLISLPTDCVSVYVCYSLCLFTDCPVLPLIAFDVVWPLAAQFRTNPSFMQGRMLVKRHSPPLPAPPASLINC